MKNNKYFFWLIVLLTSITATKTAYTKKLSFQAQRAQLKHHKKQTPEQKIQFSKISEVRALFKEIEVSLNITISPEVKKYYADIKNGDKSVVDGWFDEKLIIILQLINFFQCNNNIAGNLAEIGVWHGRSLIPLMHVAQKDETVVGIDCFESYEFNRDNSGGFCRSEIFHNNIKKYCSNYDQLTTLQGDSINFLPKDYMQATINKNGFRIFSIDGCHEAVSTKIDVSNATNTLSEGGVIIIDDYFHPGWPGVSEGVNSFMNLYPEQLKPFLITMNKIFFTQPNYAQKYYNFLKPFFNAHEIVIKKFFDVETLIYFPKH